MARKIILQRLGSSAIAINEWARLIGSEQPMLCASLDLVDRTLLLRAMSEIRQGHDMAMISLVRTVGLEYWLENLQYHNLLDDLAAVEKRHDSTTLVSCETHNKDMGGFDTEPSDAAYQSDELREAGNQRSGPGHPGGANARHREEVISMILAMVFLRDQGAHKLLVYCGFDGGQRHSFYGGYAGVIGTGALNT